MKFCSKCGKEINNDAVVCVHCGCSASNLNTPQDNPSFLWSLLGFWQPLIGLILFAVWNTDKPLTAKCCLKGAIVSFILSFVVIIIYVILFVVLILTAETVPTYL